MRVRMNLAVRDCLAMVDGSAVMNTGLALRVMRAVRGGLRVQRTGKKQRRGKRGNNSQSLDGHAGKSLVVHRIGRLRS